MNMHTRPQRELAVPHAARNASGARVDLLVVSQMVKPGAKVLDVGCGDGELLKILTETKQLNVALIGAHGRATAHYQAYQKRQQ